MPGEFEPHSGCWFLWPFRPDVWRLGGKPAQKAFAAAAETVSRFEPVTVGVSSSQYLNARAVLPDNIRVVEISYNDSWVRDCGPTFVKNSAGIVRGVDWEFNAWGGLYNGLYFPWDQDNLVARKICEIEGRDRYKCEGFVLEGGSIHVDGEGTVLTTEECLLSPGRNPGLSKEEIEQTLLSYLGAQKVLWLKKGIYCDETNGHIDNLCCFARPGEVVLAWCDNKKDPQYEISQDAFERLSSFRDARGRSLVIHKLPLPGPIYITPEESGGVDLAEGTVPRQAGDRLAGSYVNFYLANGGVVVPIFGDPRDGEALDILQDIFPDRKIVGIPAREILLGGGNIHCITQQVPK